MPEDLTYEVTSADKAQIIVDALTDDGYRAYPVPSPEVGKVRIHVDTAHGSTGRVRLRPVISTVRSTVPVPSAAFLFAVMLFIASAFVGSESPDAAISPLRALSPKRK